MNSELLLQRINTLPDSLQMLVFGYVDFLTESYTKIVSKETQKQQQDEISPEIKALLDKRIGDYTQNPEKAVSWEEVKTKFNTKHGYVI